jgi:peptide/nickel transport system permease protein
MDALMMKTARSTAGNRKFSVSPAWIWLLHRLVLGAVSLLIVSFLIFSATQALPGDIARMMLGKDASADQLEVVRQQLGLNRPFFVRYGDWLSGAFAGNLGQSVAAQMPVVDLVLPRILNSFSIVIISMVMTLPVAIMLGVYSAFYRDSILDRSVFLLSLCINALPEFVLGLLLVVLLATNVFQLVPPVALISPNESLLSQWPNIVLPTLTLFLLQSSYLYRLVRAAMIDVLNADYIEFARLKGVSQRRILFRHALPNAVVPAVQAAATVFAFSVGGVVVIEYVFNFPGIGTALTDAVKFRDIEVVQFIVLLIAGTFFVANLIADVLSILLTPRH